MTDPILEEALTNFFLGETEQKEIVLTLDQQEQFEVEICRNSFRVFAALMHNAKYPGVPWNEAELHRQIFAFLQRAFIEAGFAGIINIPPRAGKTELVCMWVAWCFGHHPDSEFIYSTSTQDLSEENAVLIKDIMRHAFYKKVFPRARLSTTVNARDKTHTTESGKLLARGVGSQITGYGAGKMIVGEYRFAGALIFDDLHKVDEARSAVMQESVKNFYSNTLETRLNDPVRTPIIGIGQRTAVKDIFGYLNPPADAPEDMSSISPRKFEVLELAALMTDAEGNEISIWPARWSVDWLQKTRAAKPWTFQTQYQQKPYNEMGEMFNVDMLVKLHARPSGACITVRSWDLASRTLQKGKTEPDYTAKPRLSYYYDSKMYVIEDAQIYRAKPHEVRKDMLNTAARDGRDVYITIPKEPAQAGVDQMTNLVEMLDGYKVKPMSPTGDKVTRAEPLAAQLNVGKVAALAHVYDLVVRELKPFPDAAHDDLVDALSDAYTFLAIPEDDDEISRRRSIAVLQKAGQFVIGEGLVRERSYDAPRPGYFPGEGEI